jgi:hypothetical protein
MFSLDRNLRRPTWHISTEISYTPIERDREEGRVGIIPWSYILKETTQPLWKEFINLEDIPMHVTDWVSFFARPICVG